MESDTYREFDLPSQAVDSKTTCRQAAKVIELKMFSRSQYWNLCCPKHNSETGVVLCGVLPQMRTKVQARNYLVQHGSSLSPSLVTLVSFVLIAF